MAFNVIVLLMPHSDCVPLLSSIANVDAECRVGITLGPLISGCLAGPHVCRICSCFCLSFCLCIPFCCSCAALGSAFVFGCTGGGTARGSSGSCLHTFSVPAAGFDFARTFGLGSVPHFASAFCTGTNFKRTLQITCRAICSYVRTDLLELSLNPLQLVLRGHGHVLGRIHGPFHGPFHGPSFASLEAPNAQPWRLVASDRRDKCVCDTYMYTYISNYL